MSLQESLSRKLSDTFKVPLFVFFLTLSLFTNSNAQIVYTFAGTGVGGFNGDSISATRAQLNGPQGLCFDKFGNLIVAENDNSLIRKINLSNGLITILAGTGVSGYFGDGGQANLAQFNHPIKVAIDSQNNIFILDYANSVVRKIDANSGIITTVAGTGPGWYGFSGDGDQATNAHFSVPLDIALDKLGNLYIADFLNNRVRKVNRITGIISTVAGNGSSVFNGDNINATSAAMQPISIAVDSSDNIYISDFPNHRIRKVNPQTGIITTVAGTGIQGGSGDGGIATNAQLNSVISLKLDKQQNLYVIDQIGNAVRKIDFFNSNIITTVAGFGSQGYNGDGNAADKTMFLYPQDCAVSDIDDIYIADKSNNRIRKIDFSCYQINCQNVYTFNGNGSWSLPENWYNNQIPPTPLPKDSKIIIDPLANGQCLLDIKQILNYGSYFIIKSNKKFLINRSLFIH